MGLKWVHTWKRVGNPCVEPSLSDHPVRFLPPPSYKFIAQSHVCPPPALLEPRAVHTCCSHSLEPHSLEPCACSPPLSAFRSLLRYPCCGQGVCPDIPSLSFPLLMGPSMALCLLSWQYYHTALRRPVDLFSSGDHELLVSVVSQQRLARTKPSANISRRNTRPGRRGGESTSMSVGTTGLTLSLRPAWAEPANEVHVSSAGPLSAVKL